MFTKDIEENCEIIEELIRALPKSQQPRAKYAAATIEKVFTGLQKDHPRDGAVALGAAWAIYKIGAKIVEQAKEGKHDNLIQLLS
jgi:hypothetical protein